KLRLRAGQCRAALPQQRCCPVIERRWRRLRGTAFAKVLACETRNIRRGGEMNNRFRALLRRKGEKFRNPDQTRDQTTTVISKPRRNQTGVQAIGSDACPAQAARELTGEQNVAKLRTIIGPRRAEALL